MNRILKIAGVAAVALVVSLAFGWALGRGMGSTGEIQADGGSSGSIIAIPGDGNRMYLIDIEAKVIMVYDSTSARTGFSFVGGRTFEFDAEFCRKSEVRYNQRGYTILEVDKELRKRERNSRQ